MSGTVIAYTFALVAIVFVGVGAASLCWSAGVWGGGVVGGGSSPAVPAGFRAAVRVVWLPAAAEALLVTLFAALWFGSLGSGGWVLLFLLVGALAGGTDRWTRRRLLGGRRRDDVRALVASLLKYLVAGGLCAWFLT